MSHHMSMAEQSSEHGDFFSPGISSDLNTEVNIAKTVRGKSGYGVVHVITRS